MTKKMFVFDLDGVLVEACDWHRDALNDALDEIGGTIEVIELPEAEIQAIDEQLQELSGGPPITGNPQGPGNGQNIEPNMGGPNLDALPIEGDISTEISESGEVALEVDGTLSNLPEEPGGPDREEIIDVEPVESVVESAVEEVAVVSETGTISETAPVAKPTLSVIQKKALSIASATTVAAIEVAGQQAYASTARGPRPRAPRARARAASAGSPRSRAPSTRPRRVTRAAPARRRASSRRAPRT